MEERGEAVADKNIFQLQKSKNTLTNLLKNVNFTMLSPNSYIVSAAGVPKQGARLHGFMG